MELTGRQRRFLRSLGHRLKPVLTVGREGITDAILRQLETDLHAHELVKVRFGRGFEDEIDPAIDAMIASAGATLAGRVGRTALLYRARKTDPAIRLPRREDESGS